MKYECGFEKNILEDKKVRGEKLSLLEEYEHFNTEPVDELLEKRKKEQEETEKRQQERLEKLRKMQQDGTLFVHE